MKEEKAAGEKEKGKLIGDGKAKLFSGDAFMAMVIEHEEAQRRELAEKEARKAARGSLSQLSRGGRWKK